MPNRKIIFTVTNDCNYDQRMIRIAGSLACAGYQVMLVGTDTGNSIPLVPRDYRQKRLRLLFSRGKLFYLEYNIRLFLWLLFQRADLLCAIDLDTILPVYFVSLLKGTKRVYDAHELFCEMKEVTSRPWIKSTWKMVEKWMLPRFRSGYTVNQPIADIFRDHYGVHYEVIRNVPKPRENNYSIEKESFLLYQGAVNEGRDFESLIPAMQWVGLPLWIYGDGNFVEKARTLISFYKLEQKVFLKGKLLPDELSQVTCNARLGFTLFENNGQSNYLSLANRFFDYVHAATPQICVDFPVYRELNNNSPVAVLVRSSDPTGLAAAINGILYDTTRYKLLQENCMLMRKQWNWQTEEKKLLSFYQKILSG